MSTTENKFSTRTIILIGLFAALSYVALLFKIPIPAPVGNPFLHMGNMFVILAALLFSGPIGGASGALGMGLFDLMNGYASSVVKTLILKFGIGIVVGLVASRGRRQDAKSPIRWLATSSIVLLIVGIMILITASNQGYEIAIAGVEKSLVINPVLYIFSIGLGVILAIICIASKNLSINLQYAVLGGVAGIAFNLVGEFLFGVVKLLVAGSNFIPAVLSAAVSLPATLINGTFSIVVAVILYVPLAKAIRGAGFGKYIASN